MKGIIVTFIVFLIILSSVQALTREEFKTGLYAQETRNRPLIERGDKSTADLIQEGTNAGIANSRTGAVGSYQFLPKTAVGILKNTQYSGLSQDEVTARLLTDKSFNEFVVDTWYNILDNNYKGNGDLIILGHYAGQTQLTNVVKENYGPNPDYANVDVLQLRDTWLLTKQGKNNDEPSRLDYLTSVRSHLNKDTSKYTAKLNSPEAIATAGGPVIPGSAGTQTGTGLTETYTIQNGDTLSKIAKTNGLTVPQLLAANPKIKDKNTIYAGDSLNIPDSTQTNNPHEQNNPTGDLTSSESDKGIIIADAGNVATDAGGIIPEGSVIVNGLSYQAGDIMTDSSGGDNWEYLGDDKWKNLGQDIDTSVDSDVYTTTDVQFSLLDTDNSGDVNLEELMSADTLSQMQNDKLNQFDTLDKDNSGDISSEELKEYLTNAENLKDDDLSVDAGAGGGNPDANMPDGYVEPEPKMIDQFNSVANKVNDFLTIEAVDEFFDAAPSWLKGDKSPENMRRIQKTNELYNIMYGVFNLIWGASFQEDIQKQCEADYDSSIVDHVDDGSAIASGIEQNTCTDIPEIVVSACVLDCDNNSIGYRVTNCLNDSIFYTVYAKNSTTDTILTNGFLLSNATFANATEADSLCSFDYCDVSYEMAVAI